MIWPDPIEAISTPAITGTSCRPDSVGDAPRTTCWNSGRYVRAPNSAKPTTSPIALVTANTRLRNRLGGSTGSAARRSTSTKAIRLATARTPSQKMNAEPQVYEVPPSVVSSTTELRETPSSTVPM
jgi:hypothetical protein